MQSGEMQWSGQGARTSGGQPDSLILRLRENVVEMGSLLIASVTFDWPQFGFGGSGWGFQTTSSWRLFGDGGIITSSGSPDLEVTALKLVHLSVVDVHQQGVMVPGDPVFVLDNAWTLEIFSELSLDPWSLTLPGVVFVGEPGL